MGRMVTTSRSLFFLLLLLLLLFCVTLAALLPIAAAAEHDAVVKRLQEYLRIQTVHPDPDYTLVSDFLLSQATSVGLEARSWEFVKEKPVILLSWNGTHPSLPSVLLNSHTDVVPAQKEKWIYHPFSATQDAEGNIYGRGSQDTKSLGMQYLEAIRNLKAQGFKPARSIHVSFVPDEEIGGKDGMGAFVTSREFQALNVGIAMDEGLASSEDSYNIYFQERSAWKLIIKATGAPGHGSKMYDNSAFQNLITSLQTIYSFRESQIELLRSAARLEGEIISINNVYLKAGTPTPTGFVMNLQPSEAEAGFDIRVPPSADLGDLWRRIREEWAPASSNLTYTFTQSDPQDKGLSTQGTSRDDLQPWWALLKEAVYKANRTLGDLVIRPSATDARYLRNMGIPAFCFSPMANTPSLLHDHNEFLNVAEYIKGIAVYEEIVRAFASYADPVDFNQPVHCNH